MSIEEITKVLKKKYKISPQPAARCYIMPNGDFLALDDYNSHNQVQWFLIDQGVVKDSPELHEGGCPTLEDMGAIRCNLLSEGFIMLSQERPTQAQYDSLIKLLDEFLPRRGMWRFNQREIMLLTPHQKTDFKFFDAVDNTSDDIVRIIKNYYDFGILTEGFDLQDNWDKSLHEDLTKNIIHKFKRELKPNEVLLYHQTNGEKLKKIFTDGFIKADVWAQEDIDQFRYGDFAIGFAVDKDKVHKANGTDRIVYQNIPNKDFIYVIGATSRTEKGKENFRKDFNLMEGINKYYRLEIEDEFGDRAGLFTGAFELIPTKETIEEYPEDFADLTDDERNRYYRFDELINELSKIKAPGVDTNFNGFRSSDIFAFTAETYQDFQEVILEIKQILKELGFKLIVKEIEVDDTDISYKDKDQIAFNKSQASREIDEDLTLDQVEQQVRKDLGVTDQVVTGPSYIFPDGKFLKIRDANIDIKGLGGTSKSGKAMHLDVDGYITKAIPDSWKSFPRLNYLLNENCIRINDDFEQYIVLPETRPTQAQYDSLLRWLDHYYFETKNDILTIFGSPTKWRDQQTYSISEYVPEDFIKIIKQYFSTGRLREDYEKDKPGIYDKIYNNLKSLGLDVYKDSPTEISAYDDGPAIREFKIKVLPDKVQFEDIHIDDKYQHRGIADKLIQAVLRALPFGYTVYVHNSINDEFWNHMKFKYKNFNWTGIQPLTEDDDYDWDSRTSYEYNTGTVNGDDIFDTTTLGGFSDLSQCIPGNKYYQYMIDEKNKKGEIKMLSPEEYYEICAAQFGTTPEDLKDGRSTPPEYIKALERVITVKKKKFPMPFIDYTEKGSQEGLHRMMAAGNLFGWDHKFPVLVIDWADKERHEREVDEDRKWELERNIDRALENALLYTYTSTEEFQSQLQEELNNEINGRYSYEPDVKFTLHLDNPKSSITVDDVTVEFDTNRIEVDPDRSYDDIDIPELDDIEDIDLDEQVLKNYLQK